MVRGISVTLPDGGNIRYAPDEPRDLAQSVSWDTEMPGGYGTGQVTIPRPANLHRDNQLLFADGRFYGPGNETLYEGYVTGVPQSSPDFVTLQFAGHATLLDRIRNFQAVIVDRELARWSEAPSVTRQVALLASFSGVDTGAEVGWDTDVAKQTLKLQLSKGETNPCREVYYDAGPGTNISSIYYSMTSLSGSGEEANLGVCDDLDSTNVQTTGDLLTGTNSGDTDTFVASTARRYGRITHSFTGTMSDDHSTRWNIAVYGNHDIALQGDEPKGVYASDVIRFLVGRSPLTAGDIDQTTSIIPHLTFLDDISLKEAVEQVTAFGGSELTRNDWGVYDNKELFWMPPGSYGRTWYLRRNQTASKNSDGPDVDQRVAGVKVVFQDVTGRTLSVGPAGSNSDFVSDRLVDIDTTNPAFRVPGMFETVDIGVAPLDPDGEPSFAINYGVAVLNTRNRLSWRGSIEVSGLVEDRNGNMCSVAHVRAGDRVVVADDPVPDMLPVYSTSYSDDDERSVLSIGAPPDTLETHLAQLAAATGLRLG